MCTVTIEDGSEAHPRTKWHYQVAVLVGAAWRSHLMPSLRMRAEH
eukprot:CAMPEP_0169285674 /NCGR_PEP_ID=MMETSP1016-20121227/58835_1 /TAXON_ID=342587 /ORGANISM="Karlodinium micrum, Strain CCMP2283" /LENGTH=44 /DNA_ID= /DNA_START= /DNA_END= /DNA_ORIENTATION=